MQDIRILPIAEEHIEAFNAAVGEVARERLYLNFFDAFPLEASRVFVMDNIANGYPQFVAMADQKMVGWIDINPKTSRETNRHCGCLGMGVLKSYRGMGIGHRLMAAAIEAARMKGFLRIELEVRATNHAAIKLYEKMGFIPEGILRKEWLVDGEYYDTHVMALLLPPLCDIQN